MLARHSERLKSGRGWDLERRGRCDRREGSLTLATQAVRVVAEICLLALDIASSSLRRLAMERSCLVELTREETSDCS